MRNSTVDYIRGIAVMGMFVSHYLITLDNEIATYIDRYMVAWSHILFGIIFGYFWKPGRYKSMLLWTGAILSTYFGYVLWEAPVSWLLLLTVASFTHPFIFWVWLPAGLVYPYILHAAASIWLGYIIRQWLDPYKTLPQYQELPLKRFICLSGRFSLYIYVIHLGLMALTVTIYRNLSQ